MYNDISSKKTTTHLSKTVKKYLTNTSEISNNKNPEKSNLNGHTSKSNKAAAAIHTKCYVSFEDKKLPSLTAQNTKTNSHKNLSDLFNDLKKQPVSVSKNILGDLLQNESDTKQHATLEALDNSEYESCPKLLKHRHILEKAEKKVDECMFNGSNSISVEENMPNKVLEAMINGLDRVNNHYRNSNFVHLLQQRLKLSAFPSEVIRQVGSLSDRFTLSREHNASVGFSLWKNINLGPSATTQMPIAELVATKYGEANWKANTSE